MNNSWSIFLKLLRIYVSGQFYRNSNQAKQQSVNPRTQWLAAHLTPLLKKMGTGLLLFWGMAVLLVFFGGFFIQFASILIPAGARWAYYGVVFVAATLMCTIGTVGMLYQQVFLGKDNSIIIPLPVSEKIIIAARLASLYITNLWLGGAFVVLAVAIDQVFYGFLPLTIIMTIICALLLPLISVFLALVFAGIYALIMRSAGERQKSAQFTVYAVLFVVYLASVYFLGQADTFVNGLSAPVLTGVFSSYLLPWGVMGHAMEASLVHLAAFVVGALIVFWLVISVLGHMFQKTAALSVKGKRKGRVTFSTKARSVVTTLFIKDWKMLGNEPLLLLNVVSTVIVFPAIVLINLPVLSDLRNAIDLQMLLGFATLGIAVCTSTSSYTAVGLNLEGAQFYITKALPLEPMTILKAKLAVGLSICMPALLICTLVVQVFFYVSPALVVLSLMYGLAHLFLIQVVGLYVNVFSACFTYPSPLIAYKRSMASLFYMLANFTLIALPVAGLMLLGWALWLSLLVSSAVYALLCVVLYVQLPRVAQKRWETFVV